MNPVNAALGCVLFILVILQVAWCMPTYDLDYLDEVVDKRGYGSSACQRCMHRPSDWGSCMTCYSRGGSSPYYSSSKRAYNPYEFNEGFINKRAYNPYELFEGKRAYNPYDFDEAYVDKRAYNPYEFDERGKRAFRDCKCCMRGLKSCCEKCYFKPYYGGGKDKRAYKPAIFQSDSDEGCGCCQSATFDFACCLRCSYYKKK